MSRFAIHLFLFFLSILLLIIKKTNADKDECALTKNICGENAICTNTPGNFTCTCKHGYNWDGISCKDGLTKWIENIGVCKASNCNKKPGQMSPEKCKYMCSKKKECLMVKYGKNTKKCSFCKTTKLRIPSSRCNGVKDKYNFYIKEISNETFVPKTPMGTMAVTSKTKIEADLKSKWLPLLSLCVKVTFFKTIVAESDIRCRQHCEKTKSCVMVKYDKQTMECHLCNERKMTSSKKCTKLYDFFVQPLNECDGGDRRCKKHAVCKIEKGHKYCECRLGFQGNAWKCKDVNECQLYKNLCGRHAHCINTLGSYKCSCNQDFVGNGFICTRQRPPHASFSLEVVI